MPGTFPLIFNPNGNFTSYFYFFISIVVKLIQVNLVCTYTVYWGYTSLSATSLPETPTCADTQQKYTTITASFNLYNKKYISIKKCSLSEFACSKLIKAEEESEHITTLVGLTLTCSTHCSHVIIAGNSAVYTQITHQATSN